MEKNKQKPLDGANKTWIATKLNITRAGNRKNKTLIQLGNHLRKKLNKTAKQQFRQ